MSVWHDRLEQSGIRPLAAQVVELLDASEVLDDLELQHVERTRRVTDQVMWNLDNADPSLVGTEAMNSISQALSTAIQHLTSWRGGSGAEYLLTHTALAMDQVACGLACIPIPASAAEASTEVASLRRSVGQHRGQMEREVGALREAFEAATLDLQTRRDEAVEGLSGRISEAKAEVAALGDEVTRVRDEVTTLLTSARSLEANNQTAFNSSQTTNQEAFAKLLAESREALLTSTEQMQTGVRSTVDKIQGAVKADLDAAQETKVEIDKLFEIAADTTLIGSYTRNANRERKAADAWRWATVGAAAVAILIGLWAAIVAAGRGADWDLLAAKVLLGAGVTGLAAYAARQSSEHRDTQRDAEHVAVQLAALKPFLGGLSQETERDRLMAEIAPKLFGRDRVTPAVNGDAVNLLRDDPSLLSAALTAIQALAKK